MAQGSMVDTIYAPATQGAGAISIVRVSGTMAEAAFRKLTRRETLPEVRKLTFTRLYDDSGAPFDEAMVALFKGPKSYTGEDMLEVYCHGGAHVMHRALFALSCMGLRAAEAGEFTRRAFLNGKMDLSQAESVMDLISAEADAGLQAALYQLSGALRERIADLEASMLDALSAIGAAIDYPDEVEDDVLTSLPSELTSIERMLNELIDEGRAGRILREGLTLAIVGRPNVGKSSLLNALLARDRAIITDVAGTTRDTIEESLVLGNIKVNLIDTAGLRDASDEVERLGIERTERAIGEADVLLLLLDSSTPLTAEDERLIAQSASRERLVLCTKADLPSAWHEKVGLEASYRVSAKTGDGLSAVKAGIERIAGVERFKGAPARITNARHVESIMRARDCVRSAIDVVATANLDCAATDLQSALRFIGAVTGNDVDAAVIDTIFARFCVGK